VRIPAKYFDEARTQVRRIAKAVEQDTIEARDATREYVDKEASLRNARAEEAQYLAILKRAAAVKDILEVSSKLAEVRGRIDESEADLRFLHHQVEMSLLTTNISARWLKHKCAASIGGRSTRRGCRCAAHLSGSLTTPTLW